MPTLDQQEISALKGRVSRLEARLEYIYQHLGLTFVEDTRLADDPQIIEALKRNNIIEAIKYYREKTGVGLAEAKSAVEEMRTRLGI